MSNAITTYMQNDIVKAHFIEMMGNRDAAAYISSVLIAVNSSDKLMECTPKSVYTCAVRAATLRLQVDPGLGQAYLVPFKEKGVPTAVLIVGYKGLYDMAIRTGKYRYINVGPIFEGEEVAFDRLTGVAKLEGNKLSDKIIGYSGYLELYSGFSKAIYMSMEELEIWAQRYSKGYDREDSFWKKEHDKMCRKTVLRQLIRKWGYLDPHDALVLDEVEESASETVEGEIINNNGHETEPPEEPRPTQITKDQAMMDLGYDIKPPIQQEKKRLARDSDKKHYDEMDEKELADVIDDLSDKLSKALDKKSQDRILEKLDYIGEIQKSRKELSAAMID